MGVIGGVFIAALDSSLRTSHDVLCSLCVYPDPFRLMYRLFAEQIVGNTIDLKAYF